MKKPEELSILHWKDSKNFAQVQRATYYVNHNFFTVRPATADDWLLLEQHYYGAHREPLPSFWPAIPNHFAHEHGGLIRFRNETGKLVTMKPGRYVAKFRPDLDAAVLSARWGAYYSPPELKIAVTADEIEEVYVEGPDSCMSYPPYHFHSPFHPVRIYGDSDLQLAYLNRGGQITARALIWPARMVYGRIYGDEVRLTEALEAAGYSEGEFQGARIQLHPHNGCFVAPYIDWNGHRCRDEGTHLVIDRNGEIDCEMQYGLSEATDTEYCDYYEERRSGDFYNVVINRHSDTAYWSENAVDNHAFWCDYLDQYVSDNLAIIVGDEPWSPQRFAHEGATCAETGETMHKDDAVTLEDGTVWSLDHFTENGAECARSGGLHRLEDLIQISEDTYWSRKYYESLSQDERPAPYEHMELAA